MIIYIRKHPGEAVIIIIATYILLIIFILPIAQMHIIVSYAYSKVFHSFWKGFLVSVSVIFIGVMLGALCAILLSRYLIANFIKKKLEKSKNKFAKDFKIVDQMFVENGIILVGMLRLMIIAPFGLTSYLLGVTSISIVDYMIGTTSSIIDIMLTAVIGCSIWQATED
jgi:uncharacterized membrane protein YdjX (TVP38/TMEM64 family)